MYFSAAIGRKVHNYQFDKPKFEINSNEYKRSAFLCIWIKPR